MTIQEIFRDSPAGQLARHYLGWTIAQYEDEKPGWRMHQVEQPDFELTSDDDGLSDADSEKGKEKDKYMTRDPHEDYDIERTANARRQRQRGPPPPTPTEVVFSPNDHDNPKNWSSLTKVFVFFQICLLTFTIYSASAVITPAEGVFDEIWGTSEQASALVLSMYVVGYGLGPLLFSPTSELPMIGRNIPYMVSFAIFIMFTAIGSGVSNFPGLVVIRFLQGFFGGPVLSTGAASASDMFPFNKMPYALALWAFFGFAGPALGPVMSGFAIPLGSWRWGMWEILIISVVIFLLLFVALPETNADYILGQRAKRLRQRTGNFNIRSKAEIAAANKNWVKLTIHHLTMPFRITILDPPILFINVYTAIAYGVYYSFFESFPLVYMGIYGFSLGVMGIAFLSISIGAAIGMVLYIALVIFIYEPYTLTKGIGSPEFRLVPGVFAAAVAPAGVFIFGYTSRSDISWVVPSIGIALYCVNTFVLLNCIFVYLPISYPQFAASIFAANGLLRAFVAAGAIHFSQPLFKNLGVGNGCAILGSIAGLCAGVFLILWWMGPTLRARSRFAATY